MAIVNPTIPTIGQPNSTEDSDIVSSLTTLRDEFNGNIDNANIKSSANISWSKINSTGAVVPADVNFAWSTWVPTWTGITVGNGTVTAQYLTIDEITFMRLYLQFGSTTTTSGATTFTLPNTAASLLTQLPNVGNAMLIDSSGTDFVGGVLLTSTTIAEPVVLTGDQAFVSYHTVGNNVGGSNYPFTWATGDEIILQGFYRNA